MLGLLLLGELSFVFGPQRYGTAARVVGSAVALVTVWILIRMVRSGVRFAGNRIEIVNPWATTRLVAEDVSSFALGPALARANLRGGGSVPVFAVAPWGPIAGYRASRAEQLVELLNNQLSRAKQI